MDVSANAGMRVGIQLPLFGYAGAGLLNGNDIRAFVLECGRRGIREFAASDHIHFTGPDGLPAPWFDGFLGLSYAAALVPGARVATTACLPSLRGPAVTAKMLVALGNLADRGVLAGICQGSSKADHRVVGIPPAERRSRFVDATKFLRAALDGASSFEGEYYKLDAALLPVAGDRVKLWLATWGGPKALNLASDFADGVLLSGAGSTSVEKMRTLCDGFRADAKLAKKKFGLGVSTCFFSVSETVEEGQRFLSALAAYLKDFPAHLADTLVIGTAEQCTAQLARYAELGIDNLYLLPVGDYYGHIRSLHESILPALQSQGVRVSF
jgi:alkanesulfonate monooxygenase SsuD/methylene tetrahydromethanopterin reductase-like flavin-dependent oxidoreductase (luciferase family)